MEMRGPPVPQPVHGETGREPGASCVPQFQKYVPFLPQSLANILGVPSALSVICNSKCVFLKSLREAGGKLVGKRINVW